MQFITNLNLNKNELQNAVLHPLGTAPANPNAGQVYYNSSDKLLYVYNGSAWAAAGGDIPSPSTTSPQMDGTASAGSSNQWSRGDHVHPTDTSRQATITGAATTITDSNLTVDRALISNAFGKVAVSDVTSTELGYLDGVTSNIQTQINTIDGKFANYVPTSQKGAASGIATLDSNGLIPSTQLPSYVDDVIEAYVVGSTAFANDWLSLTEGGSALTPEAGKIYIIVGPSSSTYLNKQYRWSGSQYSLCNPSDDVITLNGSVTHTPSFYAPTSAGTSGQVLLSTGGTPTWSAAPESVHKYTATNSALTSSGGLWTWTITAATHGISNNAMFAQLYEASTGAQVISDITINSSTYAVTISINDSSSAGTLAADTYRVVLLG